jgi:D-alanyl-lipoteichoic acid acyltransferase DltB (MBOAT superfamily)
LLVRLIDQRLRLGADEVTGPATLALFLAANYLMYLRVSGQFHIACGMLHLFGFKLPETHHHYLLATGFTDYWRRINIYWKDFMVRVFFHPIMFRLKRWPQPHALAIATAAVFVVTWALHGYQKFWLRGHWGFSTPDALFWGILGVLVMINVQNDARRVRRKAVAPTMSDHLIRAAKVAGTFVTISLLWALWNSPSPGAFFRLLGRGLGVTP